MDVRIVIAAHKPYRMPEDPLYLPVIAGAKRNRGAFPETAARAFEGDDTGDSISEKNPNYCELTVLYWAWKNLPAEYLGLAHYRRHFAGKRTGPKERRILTKEQAERLLQSSRVILPRPRHYRIETNYSQYVHAHHGEDLRETEAILRETHPEDLPAWETVMKRTWGHRFNMFIMDRQTADDYCAWLFGILAELEKRLDISAYSANDRRVFGFVGERLLDVYLLTRKISCKELPVVNLESQHWPRKILNFLKRKVRGGRRNP